MSIKSNKKGKKYKVCSLYCLKLVCFYSQINFEKKRVKPQELYSNLNKSFELDLGNLNESFKNVKLKKEVWNNI